MNNIRALSAAGTFLLTATFLTDVSPAAQCFQAQPVQLTGNTHDDQDPQIHGGQVTWTRSVGGDREIFLWNGTHTLQVTDNMIDDFDPRYHDGLLAWVGKGLNLVLVRGE